MPLFPAAGPGEQSREIDLIHENSELSSENGELVRVDPDSYEPDDDAADYTLIDPTPFLGAQNHTLHSGTDLDWYRFYGYTDRNYHFYSTGTIDTDIYLYLDDGTTLLEYNYDGGEGTNYDLYFTPPANAYYKIKVVGYNAVGAYVFCYHHVADPGQARNDAEAHGLFVRRTADGRRWLQPPFTARGPTPKKTMSGAFKHRQYTR